MVLKRYFLYYIYMYFIGVSFDASKTLPHVYTSGQNHYYYGVEENDTDTALESRMQSEAYAPKNRELSDTSPQNTKEINTSSVALDSINLKDPIKNVSEKDKKIINALFIKNIDRAQTRGMAIGLFLEKNTQKPVVFLIKKTKNLSVNKITRNMQELGHKHKCIFVGLYVPYV